MMLRRWNRAVALVFAAGVWCSGSLAVAADEPALIPRSVLLGNPDRISPQVSPDGTRLAYVAPDDKNILQVWVRTAGKDDARQVTRDQKRGVRIYIWGEDSQRILYLQDQDGDENWHLFGVDHAGGAARDYTPAKGVQAQIIDSDWKHPKEILVGLNQENPKAHDVYRIDLETGKSTLDTKNPGDVVSWFTDPDFRVRGAFAFGPDGSADIRIRETDKSDWKTLIHFVPEDADSRPFGFTADGKALWLGTNVGSDTVRLVKHDIATGKEALVAEDPGSDLRNVLVDKRTREVLAVAFGRMRIEWRAIDPAAKADLDAIHKVFDGDPAVVSRDSANQTWIVAYTNDHGPVPFYGFDRKTKKATFLFTNQPALEKFTLAKMKPIEILARDGLKLPCYLTVPPGSTGKNLPLVLDVHGGPWARDNWGYNPEHQWLANRGYAVLSVNFRGSTGFGKKFLHAGDRQWAAAMHDDLIDAVNWAVKQEIADSKRVAIYGGSYGGYAALVGATFTPDVFACAVDIVGPSNLITLLKSIPPYWAPIKSLFETRMGRLEEEEFLKSRSPLFKADRIKIPLLIAQGANDPRVKQQESEQIVAALHRAGKDVEYLLFADEGHGFARPENRLKFYAAAEAFLAKHLGGRAIPAGPGEEPPRVNPADVASRTGG